MKTEYHELVNEVVKQLAEDLQDFLNQTDKAERWKYIKRIESYTEAALGKIHGEYPTDEQFGKLIDILFKCQELSNYDTPGGWAPSEQQIKEWISFLNEYKLSS